MELIIAIVAYIGIFFFFGPDALLVCIIAAGIYFALKDSGKKKPYDPDAGGMEPKGGM